MTETKLPRSVDDKKLADHPVTLAMRAASRMEPPLRRADLARAIGVNAQTLLGFEARAAEDRDYLLPPEYVKHYAVLLGVKPWAFRPDVFVRSWDFDDETKLGITTSWDAARKVKLAKVESTEKPARKAKPTKRAA